MSKIKYLSLFSGGAGGDLAAQYYLEWECMGYVEWDKYCQKEIRQRIRDGLLDAAPIIGDIREFNRDGYAEAYQGLVDVVIGGPPCQGFSVAGKRLGLNDPRNMVPAFLDTVSLVRPREVMLENVPGLTTIPGWRDRLTKSGYYIHEILGAFAYLGYDARWGNLSAADTGANHLRKRFWLVAHAQGDRAV